MAIDVLRGIALLGVLAINITTEFRVSIFQRFLPAQPYASWIDRAIDAILMIGVDSKALALFSLLFGVGLAIQFDHLSTSPRRMVLLLRRLSALLIIGLVHLTLIWNGDILVEYALAGLIVLTFLRGSQRLLVLAAGAALGAYVAGPLLPLSPSLPGRAWMAQHVAEAVHVYGAGSFLDILAFRVRELPAILPLHATVFPRTLGLMLLGVLAWRAGALHKGGVTARQLAGAAVACSALGAAMAVAVAFHWLGAATPTGIAERMSTVVLAAGYGASIILGDGMYGCPQLARVGSPGGTHGAHQLSDAVRRPRLHLLWIRPGPLRPSRDRRGHGDRYRRLRRADRRQRLVAEAPRIRSDGVGLACSHVWWHNTCASTVRKSGYDRPIGAGRVLNVCCWECKLFQGAPIDLGDS
jgi:uncharacterized protein